MLFGRAGRFIHTNKKDSSEQSDNRDFLSLPSVVSTAISPLKIVDPWVDKRDTDLQNSISIKTAVSGGSAIRNDSQVRSLLI